MITPDVFFLGNSLLLKTITNRNALKCTEAILSYPLMDYFFELSR